MVITLLMQYKFIMCPHTTYL